MQGANYSLNQGFNYKTFKTAWIETKKWLNDVVLKTLFFSFKPVTVFYSEGGRTLQQ
jgi:hypothetical protein